MSGYEIFIFIGQATLLFTIPLLVTALGGMFSEKSGIINIALEERWYLAHSFPFILLIGCKDFFPRLTLVFYSYSLL